MSITCLGLCLPERGVLAVLAIRITSFWEIAAEENCSVIMNVDAHSPKHLKDTAIYDEGIKHIEKLGLKRLIYTKEGLVEAD